MTPLASVALHSSVQVSTECERLDSLFMVVSPTFLAAWPLASRLATSPTASGAMHETLSSLVLLFPDVLNTQRSRSREQAPHIPLVHPRELLQLGKVSGRMMKPDLPNSLPHGQTGCATMHLACLVKAKHLISLVWPEEMYAMML